MGGMKRKSSTAIAACAISVTHGNEIQLFPAGEFRAIDGRPKDATHWYIDAALASALIADFEARQNRTVVDYEHQTLLAAQNGQPAPAAGWFGKLEWRDSGLWAIDVDWTERATAMIDSGEYKYISPVFSYDKKTGAVKRLINAALTNNPALDGMDAVAASQFFSDPSTQEKLTMDIDELLNSVRWLLNLPTLATPEEIAAELQKAVELIKAGNPETAAAGFSVVSLIDTRNMQIAALTNQAPDPAKFVPIATFEDVKAQLTALTNQVNAEKVTGLVTAALSDGRLLPAQENWARDLGGKDLAALTAYLDTARPFIALTASQTGGEGPAGDQDVAELTADQLAVCTAMGVSPDDFKKTLQGQA